MKAAHPLGKLDYLFIGKEGRILYRFLEFLLFKIGVRLQDRFRRFANGKQAKRSRHREAQASNTGFATKDLGVDRNPLEYRQDISYKGMSRDELPSLLLLYTAKPKMARVAQARNRFRAKAVAHATSAPP